MTWVRVALFMEPGAAEIVRRRLAQAGIRARLHFEPAVARLWFVSKRRSGVRLEVPATCDDVVSEVLEQWDRATGFLEAAVRCPECGSLRVDYPQFTEKSLLTNLVMGVATELRLVERDFYCEWCHHMWIKANPKPRRPRAHLAPNYFLEED